MKIRLLLTLLCVVFLSDDVFAGKGVVKRGAYPFMAFIYYPDETVVDVMGRRFLRGAVLIRVNWLVTSAIQIADGNEDEGFPRKTLLARLGTIGIDKFTLNEDEHEQEREIIQIVRPYNHSATQWWQTDISLLKTLSPFNLTSAVAPATLLTKVLPAGTICSILVFTNKNWTEELVLMQLPVDLLPSSIANCGSHFFENTMTCASDGEDTKIINYDRNNFCQGNNGGPLICEGGVLGLQTYIDNNCKEPHLYQLLSPWDKFISCGTKGICEEAHCLNTCLITNKDAPVLLEPQIGNTTLVSEADAIEWIQEISTTRGGNVTEDASPTLTTIITTITTSTLSPSTDLPVTTDINTTTLTTTTEKKIPLRTETTESTTTEATTTYATQEEIEDMTWPKRMDVPRVANVEAKLATPETKWVRSAAERNMCVFQSFCIFVLASFI